MARFLRSKKLRAALWIHAGGKCQQCGKPLGADWHADHIVPWSVTKRTNVHEMQALCPECNLKKGDSHVRYRTHQQQIEDFGKTIAASGKSKSKIIAHVVPGGGKSMLPLILLKQLPKDVKLGWFVPRLNLRSQAVKSALKDFGIQLHDCGNVVDPSRGTRGFVATHQSLVENPGIWFDEFKRHRYLLTVDECHHAAIGADGEDGKLARALSKLDWWSLLLMTGTLQRNGPEQIWGVEYINNGRGKLTPNPRNSCDFYIRYTRDNARNEQAICHIDFYHYDGQVKYLDGKRKEEVLIPALSKASRENESRALYTALSTEYADQLFNSCVQHWTERGIKLLVVCNSQTDADSYAKRLKKRGIESYLAISNNADAGDAIDSFRNAVGKVALVTCQMAYEGLDVPAISHICCLTRIRSIPWIYQMLARAWRTHPGKERSWCFCPDDPRMIRVIEAIKKEQEHYFRLRETDGGGNGSPGESDFLPLSGSTDSVRISALDGIPVSPAQEELMSLIRKHGLSADDPDVARLFAKLAANVTYSATETLGERLVRLRKEISSKGNQIDYEKSWKPGTSLKRLIRLTGKSITEQSEEELKRSYVILTNNIA